MKFDFLDIDLNQLPASNLKHVDVISGFRVVIVIASVFIKTNLKQIRRKSIYKYEI